MVVENCFDGVIGGVIAGVLTTSSRFDEKVLLNLPRASADEDPSVNSLAGVFIIRFVIGLVIINSNSRLLVSFYLSFAFFLSLFVKF